MALEALRDVFLQAGQDYAKRVRQDELLAQERARQDELYAKQRADTVSDMDRRTREQIASEDRAYARVKDTEQREITNAVKRVNALGAAEASNVMRRAVYLSGEPNALDPSKMDEATVMALFPEALKKKAVQDATIAESSKIEAQTTNLNALQKLNEKERGPELESQKSLYENLSGQLNEVNRKIQEHSKSGGSDAKRISDMYSNAIATEVDRITGGDRAGYVAKNLPKSKTPPTDSDILMSSTSYPLFLDRMKNELALEKNKDPVIASLLTEQQSLLSSRRDTEKRLAALNFDFSKVSLAVSPTLVNSNGVTPAPTSKNGIPSPAALKAAIGNPAAATSANPVSSPGGYDSNEREAEGGDGTGGFYRPPVSTPAPVAAPVAAPASISQPSSTTPSVSSGPIPAWWSVERDPEANQKAVIKAVGDTVQGIPAFASRVAQAPIDLLAAAPKVLNAVPLGASFLGGRYTDPNNYVQGKQPPTYSKAPAPEQGMGATVYYDPQAEANNRRYRDLRPSTPSEVMATGNFDTKMNTTLPDITTSGGPSGVGAFFSPAKDPLLAYQTTNPSENAKPMTFGESFAKRYTEVKNSNMTPNEKAKSLQALVQTRDLLVSRGFTYDSPDPTQSSPSYFAPSSR